MVVSLKLNRGKEFLLLAVTADYTYKPEKFKNVPTGIELKWFNWQSVTEFLIIKAR